MISSNKKNCVTECLSNEYKSIDEKSCLTACPYGQYIKVNKCVDKCDLD